MSLITVDPYKCVGCNACVRTCPAPEANITKKLEDGRFVTTVNPDKCIACGECVRNCTHGARDYNDDTSEAMDAIKKGERFIVIVAPAIKSVYPEKWKNILSWFKGKGCSVFDVAFGADVCTWAHLRAIQNHMVGKVISQPCAAIVKYIEIYQPAAIKNLSPIHSPMLCAVTFIRKYMRRTEKIIALSPCIAKKNEFVETGLVDYNVTFKKLDEYFDKLGIRIPSDSSEDFKFDFDGEQGQVGGIYPRAGGLRDNLWLHDPEINITTSEGVHKVYPELDMYAELVESKKPEVFDVLSCEFGCNVGAGTGSKRTVFDVMETMRNVEQEAKSRRKTSGGFFRGAEDKLFKKFDEELDIKDFMRKYAMTAPSRVITNSELDRAFMAMGKVTEEDRNYNCHACGYRSCGEMAIAICKGLNTPDNCIVHAKAEIAKNNALVKQKHEKLAEITSDCCELSKQLKFDIQDILNNMHSINDKSEQSAKLTGMLDKFIQTLIGICENKDSMSKDELSQLAKLLGNTKIAFDELNGNISETSTSTQTVSTSIDEINVIIETINDTLNQAIEEETVPAETAHVFTPNAVAKTKTSSNTSDTLYVHTQLPNGKVEHNETPAVQSENAEPSFDFDTNDAMFVQSRSKELLENPAENDSDNDDLSWLGGV